MTMKANLFKITCLTNLHVGSGDENYGVVDKEVETDPITGYPIVHASGIKGSLRDFVENKDKKNGTNKADHIFGKGGDIDKGNPGAYVFFDAKFLFRPLRIAGPSEKAYIRVTTVDAINDFLSLTEAFGCNPCGIKKISVPDFGGNEFVSLLNNIKIEGESVGKLNYSEAEIKAIKAILGNDDFAIAKNINEYSLPVIARNNVGENRNLWYEEFVPYHSVFYMLALTPDDEEYSIDTLEPIQLGGNSTVGYGYVKFDKI